MRVLLVNKFYYRRGGDCVYALGLERMLRSRGHEVAVLAMDYGENLPSEWSGYFPSEMSALKALHRPFGDGETRSKVGRLLRDFAPEVVHLNNVHTQLSPVVGELAHGAGCRVVWTLHDYKLLCPRYDCLRGGQRLCEACLQGGKGGCLRHRCMKGSLAASLIGWAEALRWGRRRLEAMTDVFICPSRFMAAKMAEGGFNTGKLATLCNFIDVSRCERADGFARGDYYCYVGRLSHEKGVRTLIEAANGLPLPLKVIGGGPLEGELRGMAAGHVELVGYKDWAALKEMVGRARFVVVPSEWYENNPLSVLEALCLGTPVLGARIGGIPELIEEGRNGLTFESRSVEDLRRGIGAMWSSHWCYADIARQGARMCDEGTYYERLMDIYGGLPARP